MIQATSQTRSRYNRIAPVYDRTEAMLECQFTPWRERLWKQAQGRILEVGVGTGKNLRHYPSNARVTAIDLSDEMLAVRGHLRPS